MRKPALALTIAALAAASLTACTSSSSDTVTIGLTYIPDVQFAPFYVAEEAGYFADEGVDVELRHHGASEALFGALQQGEEDVVVAGADEMLQAYASGTNVAAFATLYQTYPVVLAAAADSGITALTDLAGHTVGLPGPYGENYFGLLAMLSQAGLTESDLTVEYIGYTQQTAMTTGAVDAVVAFSNNDVVRMEESGLDLNVIRNDDLPLVGISLGADTAFATDHATELTGIVRALRRAIADMEADPAAAVDVVANYVPDLDTDQALTVLQATMELYGTEPLTLDASQWEPMYQFMVANGLADADADPTGAYLTLDLGE